MTRSKIQKIKFYVTLVMFLLAQTTFCDGYYRRDGRGSRGSRVPRSIVQRNGKRNVSLPGSEDTEQQRLVAAVNPDKTRNGTAITDVTSKRLPAVTDKTPVHTVSPKQQPTGGHLKSLDTGALVRGFYVFVGLTVLVTAYVVFRSFRLSKSRAQMVRKYGVLAHRQDVEMRPLPLEEEDEEDTTVFDASNIVMSDTQRQNL